MLSRDKLEKALGSLNWGKVEAALAAGGGRRADIEKVAEIVLKTSSLVFRYPDPGAERKREQLLEAFRAYFHPADLAPLEAAFETLKVSEAGYRTIVQALAETDAGKLPVDEHTTAAIALCQREVLAMTSKLDAQNAERPFLTQHMALREEDGKLVNPDAALEHLVNIAGMTLQMHARKHKWFDANGVLVAPLLEQVSDQAVGKVSETGFLAVLWRRWENTEERARFLGQALRYVPEPEWPTDAPPNLKTLVEHVPVRDLELLHQVAFERLRDWFSQNFFEMMSGVSVEHLEVRDKPGPHALPPYAIVSRSELHAAMAICNIVNYDITKDDERPGGVRLLEWVRGYAALDKLDETTPKGTRVSKTEDEWRSFFVNWGLSAQSAANLLAGLTFRKGSRDLFDHPLIKQTNGEFLLFRPAFHGMNIAQVVLSTVSQAQDQLQKKGDAFEKTVLALFEKQGLKAYSFTEKRGSETYQVDVLVPWGEYLFLFECKNRALPQLNPVLMERFDEGTLESLAQINRIVTGLKQHPDILAKYLGPEHREKELVACVLNAMPYSIPGGLEGVYFFDYSALGRFFKNGQLMAHGVAGADGRTGSMPWLRIWAGDSPSPEDLLVQMKKSVQFTNVENTLEFVYQPFPLPADWYVVTQDFRRVENAELIALAEKVARTPYSTATRE